MAKRRQFPDGRPEWLERDPEWLAGIADDDGMERYVGRDVELVYCPKGGPDHGRFCISSGLRGESADVLTETDDWEEALELIGLNEGDPSWDRSRAYR